MKCPNCGEDKDKVLDSRLSEEGSVTRRRRECEVCGHRYTTFERPEQPTLFVIKKDGTREGFDPEKLRRGLRTACQKTAITASQYDSLAETVESRLRNDYPQEVPSSVIGEMVMGLLAGLNPVAYVRFASVYREFRTVEEFSQEIERMLRAGD